MALIHWTPFREIETLEREMNRLMNTLTPAVDFPSLDTTFVPAAELNETPEAIALRIEVPGMEAKDLDVEVTADTVMIRGERQAKTENTENGSFRSEFRYGKFQRIIQLPNPVQNDQVSADYKDGILHLHLPKVDADKNRVVKVNLLGNNAPVDGDNN